MTCPSFLEVFDVVLLSKSRVESLRPGESETPLILGPAGEILFITEETAVQKAHQAAGVLPHFTTQLLESQVWNNNEHAVIQRSRIAVTSQITAVFYCVGLGLENTVFQAGLD